MILVISQELGLTVNIADVQQFTVWEKGATDPSGFIGYCYLDLFPRG